MYIAYSLEIKINGVLAGTHSDTIIFNNQWINAREFTVDAPCSMKVKYEGYICPIYVYEPNKKVNDGSRGYYAAELTQNNPKEFEVDLDKGGIWRFVLRYGVQPAIPMVPFTITLYTDSNNQCTNFCTGKSLSMGLV